MVFPQLVKQWVVGHAFPIVYPVFLRLRFVDTDGSITDERPWQLYKFLSRMEDVGSPSDMKIAKHREDLEEMHGGRSIISRVVLERAISYGVFDEPQRVLFLFCALARVRKSAAEAIPSEKKYMRVVEGDVDDFMGKMMHICDMLDNVAKHVKVGPSSFSSWEEVVAMVMEFDAKEVVFRGTSDGLYAPAFADTTLYLRNRSVQENRSGRPGLRHYSPERRRQLRKAMVGYRNLLYAIGKNVGDVKISTKVRGLYKLPESVIGHVRAIENTLHDFETKNTDTSVQPALEVEGLQPVASRDQYVIQAPPEGAMSSQRLFAGPKEKEGGVHA